MSKINVPTYNPADLDTLFGIFQLFMRQYLNSWLATLQPVEIVSIGESNRFVNVKPLIEQYGNTNKIIPITDADIIYNIPVMQPFGANGEMRFSPTVGDQGLLITGNFDISKYKQTKQTAPQGSSRAFNWADGFFLPLSFQDAPEGFLLKNQASSVSILPTLITLVAETVNLGDSGGVGVARMGDEVTVEITSGSSAGTWKGTITSASSIVKAV